MASSNNVTPTNCSWWPISAMDDDEDCKIPDGEESEAAEQTADPRPFSKDRLVLYHWTQSFSSQKVRLVIHEKGLICEERDVSLPLQEHKEPWFMRLNLGEEVPVFIHGDTIVSDYNQIIDYMEKTFTGEAVAQLIPEADSPVQERVQQYRQLLDGLPMDAYTHGCILHPELTTDSMIPKYATAEIRMEAELEKRKLEYQGIKYLFPKNEATVRIFRSEDAVAGDEKRYAFRKVLGDIHTTLLSAVLPNAFRMVKKKPPSFFGASFLMGSLGGMGYFAYWFLKKKYM
ncbi:hypothetical protein CRUP_038779 [Coryphaenoides rupestris]|nr:hypothetical protein CRUP_038779 [Coryphaenoides rupestris]